jgi:restriction system-associated AAA family ATPase
MKLLRLEIGEQFRSLHPGFQINFHTLTENGVESMTKFQPFCFAGLNGSGKSNVLEALAAIFYHLEMCVAKYRPEIFEQHFRRDTCSPDAFTLEYLICRSDQGEFSPETSNLITIIKEAGKEPRMYFQDPTMSRLITAGDREISLKPSIRSQERAPGKEFLPDLVVGYSSGENEILSLPFIKNRLIHFDEYKEAVIKNYEFIEPETSLLYVDKEMSQAVLLACMLYEEPETTLKPLRDELGITGIRSFRMNLNNQALDIDSGQVGINKPILEHIQTQLDNLKSCTPFKFVNTETINSVEVTTIDFFVDDNTKREIKKYFKSSFELFRFFQLLYELNANIITKDTKEEVYKSKGYYTDGKLPEPGPEDRVFHFLDYMILKEIEGFDQPKELLLREFSDGEHQFLHTMGICLMLKDRRTLLLLDEPETHFNPKWRAEFIQLLNNSIEAGGSNNFLKDVLITSHSPFIISDCLPDKVLFFTRNEQKKLEVKNASELGLKTYGSSVDYILKNFFGTNLISSKSFNDLKDIIDHGTIDELRKAVDDFGESSQKQFLFKKIYEKMEKKDDN